MNNYFLIDCDEMEDNESEIIHQNDLSSNLSIKPIAKDSSSTLDLNE